MEQKSKEFYSAISVLPDHSIQEASSILKDTNMAEIPVIDDENRLVGVLAVQHILAAISSGDSLSNSVER